MEKIHISTMRGILNAHDPVSITFWDSKGKIIHFNDAIPLNMDRKSGCRNFKIRASGQIRKVREVLIFLINGMEVYL